MVVLNESNIETAGRDFIKEVASKVADEMNKGPRKFDKEEVVGVLLDGQSDTKEEQAEKVSLLDKLKAFINTIGDTKISPKDFMQGLKYRNTGALEGIKNIKARKILNNICSIFQVSINVTYITMNLVIKFLAFLLHSLVFCSIVMVRTIVNGLMKANTEQ